VVVTALVAVLLAVGAGLGLAFGLSGGNATATTGPEGVAVDTSSDLAPASTTTSGAPVDGITCRSGDGLVKYHIHVYVAIFVDGIRRRLPAGAGITSPRLDEHLADGLFVDNSASNWLYWIHVHSNDDIIHVEAPYVHTFTLGQFFDIWQQPLNAHQVGPAQGSVVAFENGKRVTGNPRAIPLLRGAVVQLDVGSPQVPFQPEHFKVIGLYGGTGGCAASTS
jgi:hypothetical protein